MAVLTMRRQLAVLWLFGAAGCFGTDPLMGTWVGTISGASATFAFSTVEGSFDGNKLGLAETFVLTHANTATNLPGCVDTLTWPQCSQYVFTEVTVSDENCLKVNVGDCGCNDCWGAGPSISRANCVNSGDNTSTSIDTHNLPSDLLPLEQYLVVSGLFGGLPSAWGLGDSTFVNAPMVPLPYSISGNTLTVTVAAGSVLTVDDLVIPFALGLTAGSTLTFTKQ